MIKLNKNKIRNFGKHVEQDVIFRINIFVNLYP